VTVRRVSVRRKTKLGKVVPPGIHLATGSSDERFEEALPSKKLRPGVLRADRLLRGIFPPSLQSAADRTLSAQIPRCPGRLSWL
jgi:hypothetical protein